MSRITPFRERLRNRKKVILFICTGNTCRSPMAGAYFRKLLDDRGIRNIEVRTAGVMTISGLLASQEAIQVMEAEGVDLRRHRSSQLTPELIRKADIILAMTPFHRQTALRMAEDAKDKTFLFKEFARSDPRNVQIADPMGCTLEVFKKCFKEVKLACEKLVEHEFVTGQRPESARGGAGAKRAKKTTGRKTAGSGKKAGAKKSAPRKTSAKKSARTTGTKTAGSKKTAPKKAAKKPAKKSPGTKKTK